MDIESLRQAGIVSSQEAAALRSTLLRIQPAAPLSGVSVTPNSLPYDHGRPVLSSGLVLHITSAAAIGEPPRA